MSLVKLTGSQAEADLIPLLQKNSAFFDMQGLLASKEEAAHQPDRVLFSLRKVVGHMINSQRWQEEKERAQAAHRPMEVS
jgi:hypothetical protein